MNDASNEPAGMNQTDPLPDSEALSPPSQVRVVDVASTLRRSRWRFLLLGVAIAALINVVALAREPDEPIYHTEALVVASELTIRVDSFPRTASAIFNGGTVAELTAARSGTGIDPEDLIPDIVDVQPIENTGVVEIDAFHPDPETAALYANLAGRALAEELNRVGPGLGTFALQIEAPVPTKPVSNSRLPTIALSLVAAVLATVGLAALLAIVRRDPKEPPLALVSGPEAMEGGLAGFDRPVPDKGARQFRPVADSKARSGAARARRDGGAGKSETTRRALQVETRSEYEPDPNGYQELPESHEVPEVASLDDIVDRLSTFPPNSSREAGRDVRTITGIGPAFEERLATVGIVTVGQLADADPEELARTIDVRVRVVSEWVRQALDLLDSPSIPGGDE